MKKFLGIISLATIALAGCTKTDVEVAAPSTVAKTIYASVNTKTVNEGLSTKWAKDDAISVFFAEEGDDAYSENTKFEISDIESGAFTGTAPTLEEGVAYDWFAYYPYTSQKESPATNKGWMTVGSAASASQVQNGNSSKAHLAGKNYPLIGKAASVLAEEDVVFQMEQATAVVAINVTNSASADLQVANVQFTAEEDIVGTYYINIAGDEPTYTGSGAGYVSNTAKLSVENGEVLTSGESATFYIAVKPFTATTGQTLKISVNGYEKTITLTKDVTFARGAIKTVNFDYDEEEDGTVASMDTFSATEGYVGGDINVSYKAEKGGAATAPAVNDGEIRVYQNGGLFTVSANNSATITKIILGSAMATTVTYSIDGGAASENTAIAANGLLTLSDLDASSVTFTCTGTDKNSRLYVNYLSVTYTGGIEPLPVCAEPIASVGAGSVAAGTTVALSTETEGATIYYTTDGSTPTIESLVYSTPIAINSDMTLKAIAVKEGYSNSEIATYTYTVPGAGDVEETSTVTIDLSTNTYTLGEDNVTWTNDVITMVSSGSNYSNYLGGDANARNSTRFYNGGTVVITPATGKEISSLKFTATTTNYANTFANAQFTNASASVSDVVVTVTPVDGTAAITIKPSGTCGFTKVVVEYSE